MLGDDVATVLDCFKEENRQKNCILSKSRILPKDMRYWAK